MKITIIASSITFAIGFGLAWELQQGNIDHAEKQRLEQAAKDEQRIHALEQSRSARVITAQDNSRKRQVTRAVDAAATESAGNGLRLATDAAVRTAQANPDACPDQAVALAVVFAECRVAFVDMAREADEWFSEYQLMLDTQPKE